MEILGDAVISRTGGFLRRANQGLNLESLSADRVIDPNDYNWLVLDLGSTNFNAFLPDATTLPLGWEITVSNVDTVGKLTVCDNGTNPLQVILPNAITFKFVLTDNSTSDGTWAIYEIQTVNNSVTPEIIGLDDQQGLTGTTVLVPTDVVPVSVVNVYAYILISALTAAAVVLTVDFTDENGNPQTLTILTASAIGFFSCPVQTLRCDAGSQITVTATKTGTSVTFDTGYRGVSLW